jgi:hypothetical protein
VAGDRLRLVLDDEHRVAHDPRVEGPLQRRHRRFVEATEPLGQVADLRRPVHRGAGEIADATYPDDYAATDLAFISRGPMF